MGIYKLTSFEECAEMSENDYSNDTASIEQYGLRCCGTQAEYDLAIRLHEVRKAALSLIHSLHAEGHPIGIDILQVVDVEAEVTSTQRFNIDRRS